MFSVIFEVLPRKENWDDYLERLFIANETLHQVNRFPIFRGISLAPLLSEILAVRSKRPTLENWPRSGRVALYD